MDPAVIGYMRVGYFRIGVKNTGFDDAVERLEKISAKHLGNCAPAVFGPGGARFAGTLADGSTLHCRFNVKVPLFDQAIERMKK